MYLQPPRLRRQQEHGKSTLWLLGIVRACQEVYTNHQKNKMRLKLKSFKRKFYFLYSNEELKQRKGLQMPRWEDFRPNKMKLLKKSPKLNIWKMKQETGNA